MEESTFSTTLPHSSAAVACNQIKPPVQLRSAIKSGLQTSSNDDDDDDENENVEDDGDCMESVEHAERNYVKTQSETVSEL